MHEIAVNFSITTLFETHVHTHLSFTCSSNIILSASFKHYHKVHNYLNDSDLLATIYAFVLWSITVQASNNIQFKNFEYFCPDSTQILQKMHSSLKSFTYYNITLLEKKIILFCFFSFHSLFPTYLITFWKIEEVRPP